MHKFELTLLDPAQRTTVLTVEFADEKDPRGTVDKMCDLVEVRTGHTLSLKDRNNLLLTYCRLQTLDRSAPILMNIPTPVLFYPEGQN